MSGEEQLLVELYAAFNQREVERMLAQLHPDVDWPNGWEGGRLRGTDAVRDYWQRQWTTISPTVEPLEFERDENGHVVVRVHQVVRALDGTVMSDSEVRHVYTFVDGRVARMSIAAMSEGRQRSVDCCRRPPR